MKLPIDKRSVWTILVIVVVLVSMVFVVTGCRSMRSLPKNGDKTNDEQFITVTYDNCEYVWHYSGYRSAMAHKGNCKYCLERNKK